MSTSLLVDRYHEAWDALQAGDFEVVFGDDSNRTLADHYKGIQPNRRVYNLVAAIIGVDPTTATSDTDMHEEDLVYAAMSAGYKMGVAYVTSLGLQLGGEAA